MIECLREANPRRSLARRLLVINGKTIRAEPELSPEREPLARAQRKAGIPRCVFHTNWDSTSFSVKINGGRVSGIHCTGLTMKYVVENLGLPVGGWEIDVLKKVKTLIG